MSNFQSGLTCAFLALALLVFLDVASEKKANTPDKIPETGDFIGAVCSWSK